MATQESSGTQAATIGTEHTLATITTAKAFQAIIDIAALVAGEYVELRIKRKVLSGGTTRVEWFGIYSWLDAGAGPIVVSHPILSTQEYVVTLKQLNGTGRSFPWSVETP